MTRRFAILLLAALATACGGASDPGGVDASPAMPDAAIATPDARSEGCSSAAPAWRTVTLPDQDGFKPRAVAAVGADGKLRVAYNDAQSGDGWSQFGIRLAQQTDGGFVDVPVAAAGGVNNEYPSLVVTGDGRSAVLYNRYVAEDGQIDVFLASGDASGFGEPVNLTRSAQFDEIGVAAAIDGVGVVHAVFLRRQEREDSPGNYRYSVGYLQVRDGAPTAVEVIADPARIFTGSPEQSIAVEPDGTAHVLYRVDAGDPADGQLVHRERPPSTVPGQLTVDQVWSEPVAISAADENAEGGAIAIDASGTVHVTYGAGTGTSQTMRYRSGQGGTFLEPVPLSREINDRAYYQGLAVSADGTVHIAYRRLIGGNADVFYRRGVDGAFEPEIPLTVTSDRDELYTSVTTGPCGEVHVVYPESLSTAPDGSVYVTTWQ